MKTKESISFSNVVKSDKGSDIISITLSFNFFECVFGKGKVRNLFTPISTPAPRFFPYILNQLKAYFEKLLSTPYDNKGWRGISYRLEENNEDDN